jgi:hypothetical protein
MAVKLKGSNVIVNRDTLYCAQGQRFTPSMMLVPILSSIDVTF